MKSREWFFLTACLLSFVRAEEEAPDRTGAIRLLEEWKAAPAKTRDELAEQVVDAAIRADAPDIAAVAADGMLREKTLASPAETVTRALKVLHRLPLFPANPGGEYLGPVFRRISRDRIEIWTPKHGWLLDGRGNLMNEARPPRHDGHGREWYGAFLPDGRWATTDLWERDDTLRVYSARGKMIFERKAKVIISPLPDDERASLIGWCRSDAKGTGWVLSVGSEGGRGKALVKPDGKIRQLGDLDPWALCRSRDLEAKGMYRVLRPPDDARQFILYREEAAHGPRVGYPAFSIIPAHARDDLRPRKIVPRGREFGFWPKSNRWWVVVRQFHHDANPPIPAETWFFDRSLRFEGRIVATRISDGADDAAMLFATADHRVISIAANPGVETAERFTDEQGAALEPLRLYADLRVGMFRDNDDVVVATWAAD